tara:strand:- start:2406 stop:3038 length:633 start_codon:yes stop_codon:yes gene_type:complete
VPKILSDIKKKQMVESFRRGVLLEALSNEYGLKKATIIKHLKNLLGIAEFKNIEKNILSYKDENQTVDSNSSSYKDDNQTVYTDTAGYDNDFIEVLPLDQTVDFDERKDLTSEPLNSFCLPKNIYMIVSNNIELEYKLISDFPEYGFLSANDQKRKVIKLFSNKKLANIFCSNNQKVIKIPNGRIFKLVSPFLLKKGITRIIFENNLLSV